MADYAVLETMAYLVYAIVSDDPPAKSFVDFYALRSIRRREMLTLGAALALDDALQNAIKRAWKRFGAAASRRTEIAHCAFLSDGQTVTRLRLHGTEPKFEPVSETVFERTFNQYRILGQDLGMLASVLSDGRASIPEIIDQTPLGKIRRTQTAMLGSPNHPANYGPEDTKASLIRLKLLDFEIARWKAKGIVPQDWNPDLG